MIQLKRILLPTDFSRFSQPAVETACALADRFQAELHLLHVAEDFTHLFPDFGMGVNLQPLREVWAKTHDTRDAEVLAKLSETLNAKWKADKPTTTVALKGKPFVEIVRYAGEHNMDLIVMGTHGRTGLPHVMLGSVAENVVRQAPCPVLTVRSTEHQFEVA